MDPPAAVLACVVLLSPLLVMLPAACCMICCGEIRQEIRRQTEERNAVELAQRGAEQYRRFAAAPAVKKKLGYFLCSAAVKGGSGRASGQTQLECAICLEVFVRGAACSEVPACRHLFHRDCIAVWMRSKSTCPLCRGSIVQGSDPLSAAEQMV